MLWDDCTQEVCCRLLTKARAGELDLNLVLADDTPERRELVRAIDMVRKRVQRAKRHQSVDPLLIADTDHDQRHRDRLELGEILERARQAVLSPRQDRIVELWMRGWTVPEIGAELEMAVNRVSDEKYKRSASLSIISAIAATSWASDRSRCRRWPKRPRQQFEAAILLLRPSWDAERDVRSRLGFEEPAGVREHNAATCACSG